MGHAFDAARNDGHMIVPGSPFVQVQMSCPWRSAEV
jgi:hypothetical protein